MAFEDTRKIMEQYKQLGGALKRLRQLLSTQDYMLMLNEERISASDAVASQELHERWEEYVKTSEAWDDIPLDPATAIDRLNNG